MHALTLLEKRNKHRGGSTKYYIDCANISEALHITSLIRNKHDISILQAIISKYAPIQKRNRHIVIKIGPIERSIKKEYEIGKALQEIPGFIKYICLFQCFDDTINTNGIPRKICNANQDEKNNKYVLIMPYIANSSIRDHKWNINDIEILKSLLTQTILTTLMAFQKLGFLHGDLHLDNILFKPTKQKIIYYGTIPIKTYGYKIVIMDFEASFINISQEKHIEYYWDNLLNMFSRCPYEIKPVSCNNISTIIQFCDNAKHTKASPTIIPKLLDLVDRIELQETAKISVLKYDPFVFG